MEQTVTLLFYPCYCKLNKPCQTNPNMNTNSMIIHIPSESPAVWLLSLTSVAKRSLSKKERRLKCNFLSWNTERKTLMHISGCGVALLT